MIQSNKRFVNDLISLIIHSACRATENDSELALKCSNFIRLVVIMSITYQEWKLRWIEINSRNWNEINLFEKTNKS